VQKISQSEAFILQLCLTQDTRKRIRPVTAYISIICKSQFSFNVKLSKIVLTVASKLRHTKA